MMRDEEQRQDRHELLKGSTYLSKWLCEILCHLGDTYPKGLGKFHEIVSFVYSDSYFPHCNQVSWKYAKA